MPTLSAHIINKFYESFKTREIAFNKSIISISGLEPRKVFLKIKGEQWACVLYSCSMNNAKIIANLNPQAFELLKKAKNFASLRLSFLPRELKNSIVFFIPALVQGYKNFGNNNTFLVSVNFTQRPPDDLIEILGKILQEKDNFDKRKDIRIAIEGKIINDIGLATNKAVAVIENIKRPCIIKNLSASGTFIVMSCIPKFIMNKKVILHIITTTTKKPVLIQGTVMRNEPVDGRKDIHGIGIKFEYESIPFEYKQMINGYLDKLEGIAKHSGK